jgi:hypothetical protein
VLGRNRHHTSSRAASAFAPCPRFLLFTALYESLAQFHFILARYHIFVVYTLPFRVTFSHVDLNLPVQGASASATQSQSSTAQNNAGTHAALSQCSSHLPLPPTTQSHGIATTNQRLHSSPAQQQVQGTSLSQSSTTSAPPTAVPGMPSNSSSVQSQTSTTQTPRSHTAPNPTVTHPIAAQPSITQQGLPAAVSAVAQQDTAAQCRLAE